MRSRPQPSPCEGVRETGPAYPWHSEPKNPNPSRGGRYALFPALSPSKTQAVLLPISSSPGSYGAQESLYRLPREAEAARAPSRARISSSSGRVCAGLIYRKLGISSSPGKYIVFSGKVGSIPLSSCPGTYTVLAGKPCRPARELMSSYGGSYIVFSGKLYRLLRENVSSSPGSRAAVFAGKVRFPHGG